MQNYLGVGIDAKVALEWHKRRQTSPQLFTSRFRNKVCDGIALTASSTISSRWGAWHFTPQVQYARYGAKQLFGQDLAQMCASVDSQ